MFKQRLLVAIAAALFSCAALAQDKVVYHFGEGLAQATNGLRNIRNHLEVDPKAKIVVVAHAQGVDFLMTGAQDANKNPYNVIVEDLKSQGVTFEVCQITLRNRKLETKAIHSGGDLHAVGRATNHAIAKSRGLRVPEALTAWALASPFVPAAARFASKTTKPCWKPRCATALACRTAARTVRAVHAAANCWRASWCIERIRRLRYQPLTKRKASHSFARRVL